MAEHLRTFVAVEIPDEVRLRAQQLITRLRRAEAKVRWVAPDAMHWTLQFLGDVDICSTPDICRRVGEAVADFAPFDVEAAGLGAFPSLANPRTIWIGMGQGAEPMIALHDVVEQALEPLGFRPESRRFRPHLTIGRVRNSPGAGAALGPLVEAEQAFASGLSTIYEVTVFSSELEREGPTHDALCHAPLKGE